MMKTLSKLLSLTLIFGLLFTACSDDDDGGDNPPPSNETILEGLLTESRTLDASVEYTIRGDFRVDDGAVLTIPAGTVLTSEVGTGNYMAVLKGGQIVVQGTAASPVIMKSNGNAGDWGGLLLCGDATTTEGVDAVAEVGGLVYGGTNDTDSSGSINYLVILDAGAQINADSQYNGLSLYAVGSGTTITNVAIANGADDGVEFFGGTVSASNFYLENLEDDAVDWTEGWNGTLSTTYVTHTIDGFSTAIEADGVNNNPTLEDFTAISSTGGLAIQIKNNSGATINGLTMNGYETSFDFRDAAPVSNLQIDGEDADPADDAVYATSPTNASQFAWATDAIGGGDDNTLPSNITSDLTLDPSVTYRVNGAVLVNAGATLTIPAGTEIVSESGTANYIAVLQGADIVIDGTAGLPVEMRSVDGNPWGGLLVCGNATTTEGVNAIAEVGGLQYGGTNDADDSGSINYVILRNTGAQINADSQFNGLSLYAVGTGTSISNVAVVGGADDGVEFFGGTVSLTNFYGKNIEDDAVDWTEGWNGTLTNTYITNTIEGFSTAIEADGVNGNPTLANFTAVSSTGGVAIQIKNDSGATINGLTLNGFDTSFDFRDNAPVSNLQIDGEDADLADDATYATSPINSSDFAWVTDGDGEDSQLPSNIVMDMTLDPSITYTVSGAVLVNSGATLTIPAGTEIVSQSGTANYIAVLKGADIEIQGTPSNPVEMRSDDGNPWGGLLVCGNATTTEGVDAIAEVGGLVYGGTDDADDSGSIEYLVLRNTGAQINADSQFNGLSLYAVGSGTSISNVAVVGGADDGVEFFGGTVNVSNFYGENIEDDAVDWTEGWNGTLTNTYITNTIEGFSTAIEADGVNGNPTLVNFTAISSTGGTAIQIKNDSGATINGLTLNGFETTFDFRDNAPASNLQVDGADADLADDAVYATSPINSSNFAWVTGDSGDESQLPANITMDMTLDPSITYTISGAVLVNSGATLTIPAGTNIVSESGTANYLAVLKGADIVIEGTGALPVEMRSDDGNPWGGLLICGDATTTEGVDAIAEVGGLVYGGTNDTDNSGSIDYLILRDTGAQINADSQFNGLSLYAVGSETSISNVAVIEGADDGVEFFGGTVSVTNFYAENVEDDSVDWTEGWNGTLENTFVKLDIDGFSTAIEADGVNNNPTLINFTAVSTTNGTAIQIKNNSGCTITGLSLTGFDEQFDFRDGAPASNCTVDGADANEATTYTSSTTVEGDFAWINN